MSQEQQAVETGEEIHGFEDERPDDAEPGEQVPGEFEPAAEQQQAAAADDEGGGVGGAQPEHVEALMTGDHAEPWAGRTDTRRTCRVVTVSLSPEKRAERGVELAEEMQVLQGQEEAFKALAKEKREELAAIRHKVTRLRDATLNSVESAEVECIEVPDYERSIWRVYRLDTLQEVTSASHELSPEEADTQRQAPIPFGESGPTTTVAEDLAAAAAEEAELTEAGAFVCAMCDEDGLEGDEATFSIEEGMFLDSGARKICAAHHAEILKASGADWPQEVAAAAESVLAGKTEPAPGFDFDESEPAPPGVEVHVTAGPDGDLGDTEKLREAAAEGVRAALKGRARKGGRR